MGCFTTILLLAGFVLIVVSLIRWFEQTADAVDARAWSRLLTLIFMPFSVWAYPSRIAAGRRSPFPLHEPVRGFGSLGKSKGVGDATEKKEDRPTEVGPPRKAGKPRAGPDPELMEKLRKKMRDQGMRPPE
jgi:hypothetical protein